MWRGGSCEVAGGDLQDHLTVSARRSRLSLTLLQGPAEELITTLPPLLPAGVLGTCSGPAAMRNGEEHAWEWPNWLDPTELWKQWGSCGALGMSSPPLGPSSSFIGWEKYHLLPGCCGAQMRQLPISEGAVTWGGVDRPLAVVPEPGLHVVMTDHMPFTPSTVGIKK